MRCLLKFKPWQEASGEVGYNDHFTITAFIYPSYLFFPQQWGLFNQQQQVFRDLDDIHSEKLLGIVGGDIGWRSYYTDQLSNQHTSNEAGNELGEEIIIAVLDTGVDIAHPDLKMGIAKNIVECENGDLPFKPQVDRDGNGYVGDCMGWNFISNKKEGDERVHDDTGHGTHVAGIIAAQINNNLGISGVAPFLKILPVKVLHKNEQGERSAMATGTLSDRLAKGILYASKRGAKVINLSLGWPISIDTPYLRNSIDEAIKKGVVMVAAAGNNNHNSPIFPCSYPGVICVGAISVDGLIANLISCSL